jgi:hypothetical protein
MANLGYKLTMDLDLFRKNLRIFTTSTDALAQNQAILEMFDSLDLDIEYKKLVAKGDIKRVLDIFSSFSETDDEELVGEYEMTRMEQVGKLSHEFFAKRDFAAFAEMIFQLTLESIGESFDLGDVEIKKTNINKLYENIPEEIYLQTFLLESMGNKSVFDWNRNDQIIAQSLFTLTVCFSDIYGFLSELDEEEEYIAD